MANLKTWFDAVFTRATVAYNDSGYKIGKGVPRFESGRYKKAVRTEEATTPLMGADTFLELDDNSDGIANGYQAYATGSAAGTRTMDTETVTFNRAKCQRIERTGGAAGDKWGIRSTAFITGAAQYNTCSFLVYVPTLSSGGSVVLQAEYYNAASALLQTKSTTISAITGGFVRYNLPKGDDADINKIYVYVYIAGANGVVYAQIIQSENKHYGTSFTNTARNAETLAIPTAGLITPAGFLIDLWVYCNSLAKRQVTGQNNKVFQLYRADNTTTGLNIYHRSSAASWAIGTTDDLGNTSYEAFSDSYTPDGWHRFTVRGNSFILETLIDGVVRSSIANPKLPSAFGTYFYVGQTASGYFLNTLFDDIRLGTDPETATEILAEYNRDKALNFGDYTTALMPCDGNLKVYKKRLTVLAATPEDGYVLQPLGAQVMKDSNLAVIPKFKEYKEEVLNFDGEIDFGGTRGMESFELSLQLTIANSAKFEYLRRLRKWLDPWDGWQELLYENDPDWCQLVKCVEGLGYANMINAMRFELPLKAKPFHESVETHWFWGGGIIASYGMLEVPCVITFYDAMTNPSIVINGVTVSYTGSLLTNEKLVIDTGVETAKKIAGATETNVLGNISFDPAGSLFPKIQPGRNVVTTSFFASIQYRDRW